MPKRWKHRSNKVTNGERFAVKLSNSGVSINMAVLTGSIFMIPVNMRDRLPVHIENMELPMDKCNKNFEN